MLQSVLEQKMAPAAYAAEKSSVALLTPYQLDLAHKVIEALQPVEEITKSISSNTATIGIFIPLIRMLIKTLEKYHNDAGVGL